MVTPRQVGTALAALLSTALVLTTPALSYGIRTATSLLAVVLLLALGATPGRRSRSLIAAALLAGLGSGLVATGYLLLDGQPSPPGFVADWVYLAYGPLAAAGLLSLPRHPQDGPWRLKALTDAVVAVGALAFLLADLVADMTARSDQSLAAKAAAVGYPLNAACVLAVLLAVLPRVQAELRPYLRVAGTGVALLVLGDVGYSVGTLHSWYTPTTWPAAASQAGLVLVALSPLRARRTLHLTEHAPLAPSTLESAAPFLVVAPGIALTGVMIVRGQLLSTSQMATTVLVGAALLVRQLLSNAEQSRAISRLQLRERQATAEALRDPLTQLGNRTALHAQLSRLLRGAGCHPVALALLDLDDFKDVNDTHGHDTGDAVLREVARRLDRAAPPGALVARLGGDEFAV